MTKRTTPGPEPSPDEKRELLKALLRERAQRQEEPFALSYGQQALWFLYRMAPQSSAYHFVTLLRIREVDLPAFERSLQIFIDRHPALRSTYTPKDGVPMQTVRADHEVELLRFDATGWGEEELQDKISELRRLPFDLERGPVYRFGLFTRSGGAVEFLFVVHHIAYDGFSTEVLGADLAGLYSAARSGGALPPALTKVQYRDFVTWQHDLVAGAEGERQLAYWERRLGGELPVLELPADRPRGVAQGYRGAAVPLDFSLELGRELRALARSEQLTLFVVLLAGFQALLHRYSGQREVLVATPMAGRTRREFEKVIGYFVNPIVLRTDFEGNPTFRQLLHQVRATVVEGIANQDYPFPLLVERLHPQRDTSRNPVFQAMIDWESKGRVAEGDSSSASDGDQVRLRIDLGELSLESLEPPQQEGQVDVALDVREIGDKIYGSFKYDSDLFDAATAARMEESLRTLLGAAAADPDRPISELPLLSAAQRRRILEEWNRTQIDFPRGHCLHHAFEQQARTRGDAVAVSTAAGELTYGELDRRAERLARHLQGLGVGPEQPVGICVERSADMMVGLLGILKAGGAYLPLDPAYPRERLAFMLEDSGTTTVVTESGLRDHLPAPEHTVLLDDDAWQESDPSDSAPLQAAGLTPESLAYVIYTSGSTGKPKGVKVPHRAAVNFVNAMRRQPGMDADDVLVAVTTISFDIHVLELFLPLTVGARVEIVERETTADGKRLLARLRDSGASIMQATPTTWRMLVDAGWDDRLALKVLCGGEAMPLELARQLVERCDELWNMYGPTETTVWSSVYRVAPDDPVILVGRPIDNTRFYILDDNRQPVPIGVAGELYIGGSGVTHGYLDRPELTAERFVESPFDGADGLPLYRTGDLARYLPDGNVQVLGRLDHQVKLRGFRIELGEIETALGEHDAIKAAVVVVREDRPGDQRLVAYLIPETDAPPSPAELRPFLREKLPDYMVPTAWVTVAEFPLTPNRKVDRKALPAPEGRSQPDASHVAPRSETEETIASVWEEVLGTTNIGVRDNFFDLGGHSLLLLRVHAKLTESLGAEITIVDLFQYPTVEALAAHLSGARERDGLRATADARIEKRRRPQGDEDWIAVVGLAGRFPGAADVDEYWSNLKSGVESVTTFTDEELRAVGVEDALLRNPRYVRARPELRDVDMFDASFFGYPPREAELIDPQQRLFLECAWQALENAAYDPHRFDGPIGVFAGTGVNTYLLQLPLAELAASVGTMQVLIGNDKDFLPTRVSYKLNLRGPSVNVQTACSTSLVAVHLACRSLRDHECDLALAGGVTVNATGLAKGYLYQEEGIASPDGHCRAFDAAARGTLFGDGVGIVVLKRLSEALADGDSIHAVIRGTAINNDGSAKVGYTAPSVEGQSEVIALALAEARVSPRTVSYIEAHGTGTALGDPIELKALTRIMREETEETGFCGIGSVKTNFGHLDAAAGVAGLIKTVLALENRYLPPSLHFSEPNPELGLDGSPFYITAEGAEWPAAASPRRAGVSSFGIGGTNCHIVLEEPPTKAAPPSSRPWHLLALSARSETALEASASRLADRLGDRPDLDLADVAYTLQNGRHAFRQRRFVVCQDTSTAVRALAQPATGQPDAAAHEGERPLAFLFPGQGSQYVGMGAELYRHESVFRREFDRCADGFIAHLGQDLREIVFPTHKGDEEAAARLRQTAFTQPALFACQYALASLWSHWGLRPQAMIGHSIGEYVAACLSSVFSLDAALELVAARGKMMQELPAGAMLSVALPEADLLPLLADPVSLAAVNAPALSVASGPAAAIDSLADRLERDGIACRRLHTSHAFHSPMMDPILERFTHRVAAASPAAPQIPFVSNLTGTWITDEEAMDPEYWARHLRGTVRFSAGIETLIEDPARVLLEVGPGTTLSSLARQHDGVSDRLVLASLRPPQSRASDQALILETLGRLWVAGLGVDWSTLYEPERRQRIPLPTYPFERQRFWMSAGATASLPAASTTPGKRADVGDWFYTASWKRTARPAPPSDAAPPDRRWLVLLDDTGIGARIADRLLDRGCTVTRARPGDRFHQEADGSFALNPSERTDFDALLSSLATQGGVPERVVHAWCLGDGGHDGTESFLDRGFRSLLHLPEALSSRLTPDSRARIEVVADQIWDVTGAEPLVPEKAPLLASCKVIPQEYANLSSRWIDLDPAAVEESVDRVWDELHSPLVEPGVAYRGRHRWVQHFETLSLPAESTATSTLLRENGVYLITGGLGRIGLELARLLAETTSAKLVLTGRSPLPERESWDSWLREHGDEERSALKIRRVRELESLGAEVLTLVADVSDPAQMSAAVASALARFGTLNGVIHAAGQVAFTPIRDLDEEVITAQLGAKVRGLRVLDEVIPEADLDFVLLTSSLASILGGIGQAAYAAANLYMDAFAERKNRSAAAPWISLKWDAWEPELSEAAADRPRATLGMSAMEGVETVRRLLAGRFPPTQPIISTVELQGRLDQWIMPGPRERSEGDGLSSAAGDAGASIKRQLDEAPPAERRELVTDYLCRRVVDLLGHGQAETDQPLLHLGLDSLMAVQLRNTLSDHLGINLSVAAFLEGASIDSLVEQILAQPAETPTPEPVAAPTDSGRGSEIDVADQLLGQLDELSAEDVDALLETIDDRWEN